LTITNNINDEYLSQSLEIDQFRKLEYNEKQVTTKPHKDKKGRKKRKGSHKDQGSGTFKKQKKSDS
jgi:hypothetical protein